LYPLLGTTSAGEIEVSGFSAGLLTGLKGLSAVQTFE